MRYIANAFSLQMLPEGGTVRVKKLSGEIGTIRRYAEGRTSIIGHADFATTLSNLLKKEIAHNRESVTLEQGDTLLVAQVIGGRLPEGTKTLPKGFSISWLFVEIENNTLRDWKEPITPGSIYGAIQRAANNVADFVGGKAVAKMDRWNNLIMEIKAPGFHATLWDD